VAVRPPRRRSRGQHFLRSRAFAEQLVEDARVAAGELVLDIGAGEGILTGAIAAAGARVVAVELDPRLVAQLRRRFAGDPRVEIVAGDATRVAFPAEPFRVLANVPFAATSPILRRLLDDPGVPLTQLDAVVEWGFAARKCAVWPATLTATYWSAWHELELVRRIPRTCFVPPPSVDAALLRATRRHEPFVPHAQANAYRDFLRRSFGDFRVERALGRACVHRAAHEHGFDPHARGRDLDARQWAMLFNASRSSRRSPSRAR
jgi:16S rRNA A1518/A1519 N6-dimethyltransferase RsmA/KsgA/DIM1 with predicted DNA glycosylase/AP lyase activity